MLSAYGWVRYRPSLRFKEPPKQANVTVARPSVAILGFRTELSSPKLKWLPTAVTELLAHELAAAETSLRVLATDTVELTRRSLGVPESDVADPKSQQRLEALLGATIIVYGTISAGKPGSEDVLLRLRAVDARTGGELSSLDADLGPGGTHLVEALPDVGARLRKALGASLTAEQEAALSALRAHNLDAAKAYAEGTMLKQRWDLEAARSHLEVGVVADPSFLDAQRRMRNIWGWQGNKKEARKVLLQMRARQGVMTARQAAELDAMSLAAGPEPEKNVEARMALFDATPDDLDLAKVLLAQLPPRAGLQLIKRLRQVQAAPSFILDILEGEEAAGAGDTDRAEELFAGAAERAKELGAEWELGWIRERQGTVLYLGGETSRRLRPARRGGAPARGREFHPADGE